jgi:C_GCAxxG_C_C family probable redox protein
MVDKVALQKKVDELAVRVWDDAAIGARVNKMVKNGIPRKKNDPKELKANKAKILAHVELLAEEYNYYFKNCAQGTALALFEEFGLGSMEIIKALTPFPGVGGTGDMCGGITGALMAFGLFWGPETPPDFDKMNMIIETAQKYMAKFEGQIGHMYCADIIETVILGTRINPGDSPEAMMDFANQKGFEKCGLPPGTGVKLAAEMMIDSL